MRPAGSVRSKVYHSVGLISLSNEKADHANHASAVPRVEDGGLEREDAENA